jgi:chromosome segregation ATPase
MFQTLLTIGCGLALGVAVLVSRPAQAPDRVDDLQKRIETLERIVVSNPLQPRSTVVSRLTEVEKTLEDTERLRDRIVAAGQGGDRSLATQLDRLRRAQDELDRRLKAIEPRFGPVQPDEAVDRLRRSQEDLERRLKAIETAAARTAPAGDAIEQVRRTIGELDRRLRTVEAAQPRNANAGGDVATLQRKLDALERQFSALDGRIRNLERAR